MQMTDKVTRIRIKVNGDKFFTSKKFHLVLTF